MLSNPVLVGISAFILTYVGVALVRTVALRRRWLDYPNERSSHLVATPRGGGVAIVVTVEIFAFTILGRANLLTTDWFIVLAAAAGIAAVSWMDDLRPLSNTARFVVHVLAASVALLALRNSVADLPFAALSGAVLGVLWIVGLTNAYNFMDGIDLIAAGQAFTAGVGWIVIGTLLGAADVALIGVLITGGAAGFAIHNRPPARIFMGDVGSAFIGYLLATVAVISAVRYKLSSLLAGILLVWPFVFDTTFTFFRRLWKRENVFRAHRSHLYQRLVVAGVSHLRVSLLYSALAAVGVACSTLVVKDWRAVGSLVSAGAVTLCAIGLWLLVRFTERRNEGKLR